MGIQICSNEGSNSLQRGDNHICQKMGWDHLKIFSRTTRSISTKFDRKHPWVKGIQVCSCDDHWSFPRGDNSVNVKIHGKIRKNKNLLQNHWANFVQTWYKLFLGDGNSDLFK